MNQSTPRDDDGTIDDGATPKEEAHWLRSTAVWSIIAGIATVITAVTAVMAVFVGFDQVHVARELQRADAAYQSWAALNAVTLENPDLACPDTDEKFNHLMTTRDPRSDTGATYQDRYTAYGYMQITTFEQILQMAPNDARWRFLIEERIKCHAPAIRYLMAEGTYERRYSCRLRHVIAEAMDKPAPACRPET